MIYKWFFVIAITCIIALQMLMTD